MTVRPVFIAGGNHQPVIREETTFLYYSGSSDALKKQSIQSLHQTFLIRHPGWRVLEISGHSPDELGVKLNAFNLTVKLKSGQEAAVERTYQAGKIFENGGPYLDLLEKSSKTATKDPRLKNSGKIIAFEFEGERFPAVPRTCFYNWLYLQALREHPEYGDALMEYDAFTDILFNPRQCINTQARAAAAYKTLRNTNLLEQALESKEAFIDIFYHMKYCSWHKLHKDISCSLR